MKRNVGEKDRTIRIILSILVFPLLFIISGPAKWVGLASLPLLGTALARRCGAYAVLGKSTCTIED
ncbi:MAG: DUF2892 domain-containing protein [Alkalibacterium sp.]|nr:DUF2892 domain-containing protein [Alkalibacterium sp.]